MGFAFLLYGQIVVKLLLFSNKRFWNELSRFYFVLCKGKNIAPNSTNGF